MAIERIEGEPSSDYHGNAAVSHSMLEVFRDRPSRYFREYVKGDRSREHNSAFDLGAAFHSLLLEGKKAYRKEVAINRKFKDFKTKAARVWRDEQRSLGKVVLSKKDDAHIKEMVSAVEQEPEAISLLSRAIGTEVTYRGKPVGLPFEVQCRVDCLTVLDDGRMAVVDVKTTAVDVTDMDKLQRVSDDYGYFRQAGFYLPILEAYHKSEIAWLWLFVEKGDYPEVCLCEITPEALDMGRGETEADLSRLKECVETGSWREPRGIVELDLPYWRRPKEGA